MRCLIYGTCYIDSPHRKRMLELWITLHSRLNRDCDLLLVDSASPISTYRLIQNLPVESMVELFDFGDNVGHLSRKIDGVKPGRDGWGRAFCKGIEIAIERGYDYVAHIEGDSLFRLPVKPFFEGMWRDKHHIVSIPVKGTKRDEIGWVETGLMFMSVFHMRQIDFVRKYDWPNRRVTPTPERVIFQQLGKDLTMTNKIVGLRGDKNQIGVSNCASMDWITHCWDHTEVYEAFVNNNLVADIAENYSPSFFEMHREWEADYSAIADIIADAFQFYTAVDLGCGNGFIVKRLREIGKDAVGVDGSKHVLKWLPDAKIMDLSAPQPTFAPLDLAICLEVAEHIPEEGADNLVDNICRSASEAVVFSAAKAGRGGHLHVNEQPAHYWIEKFNRRGFEFDLEMSKLLRWEIADKTAATWWFALNALVFRRA